MRHPVWLLCLLALCASALRSNAAESPNVVLVMADDLGYGDVQPLNDASSVPTPGFNRLARAGVTFTDAHTPSAVCTPTRYGLLTGRYCWRTSLKRGVLNGYGRPLIEDDRPTLASVLGAAGYQTYIVGKWHLGLGLSLEGEQVDLSVPLTAGPHTVGFGHSFVIPASLDFPPYAYFRDGKATTATTRPVEANRFPAFWRAGPMAADFDMEACLDRLTDEATAAIRQGAAAESPFFLYYPLTAPHKPVLPAPRYRGKTDLGPYGDFIVQVDGVIERVLDALDEQGVADETLVIVTSDNGSFMYRYEDDRPDHTDDATIQAFREESHTSNGPWRGTKADIWEAGHRVPFFVRWPGKAPAGGRCDETIGLVDVMATLAEITGASLPERAGPDSQSFAALIETPTADHDRSPLVMHSAGGMFAVRQGPWKLVAGNGSGGRQAPKGKPFERPYHLFNLEDDPGETTNLIEQNPAVAKRLEAALDRIRNQEGRSE